MKEMPSKKKRGVIIVAVLAALALAAGGIYLGFTGGIFFPEKETDDNVLELGDGKYALSNMKEDVAEYSVANASGQLHFTPSDDWDGYSKARWAIRELDGELSHNWNVYHSAAAVYKIPYLERLDVSSAELGKYGLDSPQASVTLTMKDGNSYTFSYGTELQLAEDGGGGYYMMRSGDSSVYVVESFFFKQAGLNMAGAVSTVLYENIGADKTFSSFDFYDRATDERIKLELSEDGRTFMMTEPMRRPANSLKIGAIIGQLYDIEASKVMYAGHEAPPDDILELYGMNDPEKTLVFTYFWDEKAPKDSESSEETLPGIAGQMTKPDTVRKYNTIKLEIGLVYAAGGDLTFLRVNGGNTIYALEYNQINEWYEMTFETIASRLIYAERVTLIDSITFDTDFKVFKYDLESTTKLSSVTLNGAPIETSVFQSLYSKFAGLAFSERGGAEPGTKPYITATVRLTDGRTDVIKFLRAGPRRYEAVVNGSGGLLVEYDAVENFFAAMADTDKGKL